MSDSSRWIRDRSAGYRHVVTTLMVLAVFAPRLTFGAGPAIEVAPSHSEFFVGEAIIVRVKVSAPPDAGVTVVKLNRLYNYGLLHSIILDPKGKPLPGGPPMITPPARLDPDDLVSIPAGGVLEGDVPLFRAGMVTGAHEYRVSYRPVWRAGAEHRHEGKFEVIDIDTKNADSRVTPGGASEPRVEVLKLRSENQFWLAHRNLSRGRVTRIEKIRGTTTFSIAVQPATPTAPRALIVSLMNDAEERQIRIDYVWGHHLPDK